MQVSLATTTHPLPASSDRRPNSVGHRTVGGSPDALPSNCCTEVNYKTENIMADGTTGDALETAKVGCF